MSAAPRIKTLLQFTLEVQKGPHVGEKFSFHDKSNVFIGRGSENEICLSKDPHISRQHAEIKQLDGVFYVSNLSQKNFILVNGDRSDVERLEQNIVITVGDSELKFKSESTISEDATVAIHQASGQLPVVAPMPPKAQAPAIKSEQVPVVTTHLNSPLPMAQPPSAGLAKSNSTKTMPVGYKPPKFSNPALPKMQSPSAHDGSSRTRFYGAIVIGILIMVWIMSGTKNKKEEPKLRSSVDVQGDIAESEKSIAKLDERIEKMKEPSALRAQENYIRGFREYRQGNYLRAIDHFQIVLSLDPSNELADRYKKLAITKQDELVKSNMIQGRKYREKRNYRLCKSSFLNALVLIQYNKQHPDYLEADRFLDECDKALKGRM